MPKIRCKCDTVISLGAIPCVHKNFLVQDTDLEVLLSDIHSSDDFNYFTVFHDKAVDVITCPNCGRLWIDFNNANQYVCYAKEDEQSE